MPLEPKQPPYSIAAEQSVLGGICLRNSLLDDLAGQLVESDFYRADHALIYAAMQAMHVDRQPIDFVTLSEYLRARGQLEQVGGLAYIGSITGDCPSAANVLHYAKTVRAKAVLRNLIAAGQDIADLGFSDDGRDPAELVDLAEQQVFAIRGAMKTATEGMSYGTALDRVKEQMERNRLAGGSVIGLSTGLMDLDRQTSGLQDTDLIIVAGRPSMGKSTLAQNIADHIAVQLGKRTAFFTMEMSADQVAFRALANRAKISMSVLRGGNLTPDEADRVTEAEKSLRRCPMIIDETGGWSPAGLRARARKYAQQGGLGLIVVDYIQLMQIPGSKENRTGDVSEISRSLKAMAKELRIPVIALSQLNRGVEQRENKRPVMSDLRESGGIEQDADVVLMVYRDEVYRKDSPDRGTAELLLRKQRNGGLGDVRVQFEGEFLRFSDLPSHWMPACVPDERVEPPKRVVGFRSAVQPEWSN